MVDVEDVRFSIFFFSFYFSFLSFVSIGLYFLLRRRNVGVRIIPTRSFIATNESRYLKNTLSISNIRSSKVVNKIKKNVKDLSIDERRRRQKQIYFTRPAKREYRSFFFLKELLFIINKCLCELIIIL